MRVIIAGSRTVLDMQPIVDAVLASGFPITTIISGGADGVDTLAIEYAKARGLELEVFPAEWKRFGYNAGFMRNTLMAGKADALIAVWDGKSKGTRHMIKEMDALGKPLHIKVVKA